MRTRAARNASRRGLPSRCTLSKRGSKRIPSNEEVVGCLITIITCRLTIVKRIMNFLGLSSGYCSKTSELPESHLELRFRTITDLPPCQPLPPFHAQATVSHTSVASLPPWRTRTAGAVGECCLSDSSVCPMVNPLHWSRIIIRKRSKDPTTAATERASPLRSVVGYLRRSSAIKNRGF